MSHSTIFLCYFTVFIFFSCIVYSRVGVRSGMVKVTIAIALRENIKCKQEIKRPVPPKIHYNLSVSLCVLFSIFLNFHQILPLHNELCKCSTFLICEILNVYFLGNVYNYDKIVNFVFLLHR